MEGEHQKIWNSVVRTTTLGPGKVCWMTRKARHLSQSRRTRNLSLVIDSPDTLLSRTPSIATQEAPIMTSATSSDVVMIRVVFHCSNVSCYKNSHPLCIFPKGQLIGCEALATFNWALFCPEHPETIGSPAAQKHTFSHIWAHINYLVLYFRALNINLKKISTIYQPLT